MAQAIHVFFVCLLAGAKSANGCGNRQALHRAHILLSPGSVSDPVLFDRIHIIFGIQPKGYK